MRTTSLFAFLQKCLLGWPLHFGGGASAPPSPPPAPAPVDATTSEAKKKVNAADKRRIGGMDAASGSVLGSLKQSQGMTSTLGGSAKAYTGEP